MFKKSILTILILAACLQLNTAEEKFANHQVLVRYGAGEFVKDTFGSVRKGIAVAEDVVKDLKAQDLKDEADKTALEKLEKYLELAKKEKDTDITEKNLGQKMDVLLNSLFLLGNYKTKEGLSITDSQAVKDLLEKHNFQTVREEFFKDFNAFAEKFTKIVEDFLTYGDEEQFGGLDKWVKPFKTETDNVKRLQKFLFLFVNIGQFEKN